MEKFCQSCGIPMSEDIYSKEKNGEISKMYCMFCYEDGEFLQKNITYSEMRKKGIDGINNTHTGFKRLFYKIMYSILLKSLKRWK